METSVKFEKMVLIEFGATWCKPCQLLKDELNEIKEELNEVATMVHVDIDKEKELTACMGITSVPTLLLFDSGIVVNQANGFMPKEALLNFVDKHL